MGRPNVGKSSLLNALAGEMISIVEPTAGVTRDRVSTFIAQPSPGQEGQRYIELVDTGGYGIVDSDELSSHIEGQIFRAIESADLIVFMVDIRDGLTLLDEKIAGLLRRADLNVIGVANKADSAKMFPAAGEFSRLGFGDFLCISAVNNLNKAVLLETIFERLADREAETPPEPIMKIAMVGKRNAGKSSMVNAIAGADRVIVSEVPGTTRDSVDVRIEKDGKTLVVIDTAGVRKPGKMADSIEFYGSVRAHRSIQRADIVWFLVDATLPLSQVDKKLARQIAEEYRSCIIVVNKWDLAKDVAATGDYEDYLTAKLPVLKYAPIAFTTATAGRNVQAVLDLSAELFKQTTLRISTGRLNKAFETIRNERSGAKRTGTTWPRVYYATQIATNPVTILMFVNNPKLFDEHYLRYVANRLQMLLPIGEVPVRLFVRSHRNEASKRKSRAAKR